MDHSKWKEVIRGNWSDSITAIVLVMLWAEYKLYVSGSGSPKLTWIKGH